MRFGNRKGIIGVELLALVAAIGAVLFFAGPSIGKGVNNIFAGTKNQQKQTRKMTEQYSMFYKDAEGNYRPAPVPYKRTEESLNFINTEPPETLWQKFTKLGAMAVVIIVILSYLGIWPIITLWWNKKIKPKIVETQAQLENLKTEKEGLTADAKKIVLSVDEGLTMLDAAIVGAKDPAIALVLSSLKRDFLTALSRKQDSTTKKLVAMLKND